MKILWLVSSDPPVDGRHVDAGRVATRRSRSPRGTGSSGTRRTSTSCGRLVVVCGVERPVVGHLGRALVRRPGCRAGSSTRTCRGCCRRRCCRPATSRRRSGRRCPSGSSRCARRTGSGCRPPVSSRTRWATYTPETAVVGTVHDADTAQFPQSIRPVGCGSVRHAGWVCGSDATASAPRPPSGRRCPGSSRSAGCRSGRSSTAC